MEASHNARSGRSLFELGEIRHTSWKAGRPAASSDSSPAPVSEGRHKNVNVTERQLSLAIGAIERVSDELKELPGTEGTLKEYDVLRQTFQSALAVLPPAL